MHISKDDAKKEPLPDWGKLPLKRFLNHHHELEELLRVSLGGISSLRAMPRAVEFLQRTSRGDSEPDFDDRLQQAKRDAEFAEREIERGFPILYAQSLLSLWSSVEHLIQSILANLICSEPVTLKLEPILKLKVRVGDILLQDDEARALHIVGLLDREVAGASRFGINRFESLLEPFGLSGAVPEEMSTCFYEMHQLRNLHAHRFGYADQRFRDACPWLIPAPDGYVAVSHDALLRFFRQSGAYGVELMYRVAERHGWTREEFSIHMDESLRTEVSDHGSDVR